VERKRKIRNEVLPEPPYMAALISVSLALSQTPVYGYGVNASRGVPLYAGTDCA